MRTCKTLPINYFIQNFLKMENQIVSGSKVRVIAVQDPFFSNKMLGKVVTVKDVYAAKNEKDTFMCLVQVDENEDEMMWSNQLQLVSNETNEYKLQVEINELLQSLYDGIGGEELAIEVTDKLMEIAKNHALKYAEYLLEKSGVIETNDLGFNNELINDYETFISKT